MLRSSRVGEPWHVVFRFASAADLGRWEASAQRRALLHAGEELVHSSHTQRVTGLETWFALPGRTTPAPPKWKMFVLSVCGIVLQLVLNLAFAPFGLALPLRVLLTAVAVTALMTWLVMRNVARLLQNWLYAPTRRP